jgi:hypothetical protein
MYNTDEAPYIALGFKSRKSNGKYQYEWFLKVQFTNPDLDRETLADKATPKYPTIKGLCLPRVYDGKSERRADAVTYVSTKGATWFNSVEGTTDTMAPTISSQTPANATTGVSKTGAVTLTFSKALLPSTLTLQNIYLINTTDGSVPAATLQYNSTTFTVTLTPTSSLAATTKYIIVVDSDVTDLSNNHFVPANTTFTTGS